jgi:membrane protease YdiL (CAAX protease family)
LAVALALRLDVGGDQGSASAPAGLAFAAALALLVVSAGWRPGSLRLKPIVLGVLGGLALVIMPLALRMSSSLAVADLPFSAFAPWAVVVGTVAVAEEVLLRGVLFSLVEKGFGSLAAAAVGALVFAFMHVPLYGWSAFPLDLVVGLWLGGLRAASGSVVAPAAAHTLADLASWWLI